MGSRSAAEKLDEQFGVWNSPTLAGGDLVLKIIRQYMRDRANGLRNRTRSADT
jgi:hypothetical protein